MLVYFFCTLFVFVCSIKCTAEMQHKFSTGGVPHAGDAFYAAYKFKKCAEKRNFL